MATVLLTDGQQRKTLAAVRSLGRAGHRPIVAEATWFTTSFFSRYARGRLVHPAADHEPQAFRRWLIEAVRRHGIDVLLPMDDDTTELAIACAAEGLSCAALLPPAGAFAAFRDKEATYRLAQEVAIPVPPWRPLPADVERAVSIAEDLGYPVAIKPRRSSGGRGLRLARDAAQLRAALAGGGDGAGERMLVRWIGDGPQFDVCLLFDRRSRPVASFVQRELRHYPLTGGPSTVQESVHRPDLAALAERLLAAAGWVGPAEVEFREGPDGTPWLMEVNPRFWASLALALHAGVDFPRYAVELALGREPQAPERYPAGLRCRWMLPGDILHYLQNPRRSAMDPPFWRWDRRTRSDVFAWDDPLPVLGFALGAVAYLAHPEWRRRVLRPGAEVRR
ncbi:MAG: ATP-grasp domain-containing protein [Firmicutes bacterium]|nr:ATP-grasp domain-containing protein [Bacillota bacterium]